MKKIINLLTLTVALLSITILNSCSSEDDNGNDNLNYSVTLEVKVCKGIRESYCITKEEYERIEELINSNTPNETCIWISIRDVNFNKISGYYRSSGASSSSNSVCN